MAMAPLAGEAIPSVTTTPTTRPFRIRAAMPRKSSRAASVSTRTQAFDSAALVMPAGGPSCPWHAPSGTGFAVWREDDLLTLTVGEATATCAGPAGRVGVGLLAPMAGEAVVRALRVGR